MSNQLMSIAALAFSLLAAACGGSNEVAGLESINGADVPLPIMSVFTGKYPDAVDVTWEKGTSRGADEYTATFTEDGKKKNAEFSEREGVVIEE